jgi:nitrate/nitrite transporter NarK
MVILITASVASYSQRFTGFAYLPTFWSIPTEILGQAAAVGMINAVGSVAGFAGPYLFGYLNARTGSLSYGLAVMAASALAGGMLILSHGGTRSRLTAELRKSL